MSEWNASLQEIAQIKVLIRLNQHQSVLGQRVDEILAPLSADPLSKGRDIFLSQIVAREKYLLLLGKLVEFKATPETDMVAVDTLIEKLVAAKIAYSATHSPSPLSK